MAAQNLFQQYMQPPKSVSDYMAEADRRDLLTTQLAGQQRQNALAQLAYQQQADQIQQTTAERNALRQIAAGSNGNRGALITGLRNSGLPGLMTQADTLEQSGAKLAESNSIAAKNTSEADTKNFELQVQKANKAISDIAGWSTPQEAVASVQQHLAAREIDPAKAQQIIATIPSDPVQFAQYRKQMLLHTLDAKTQLEMTKPSVEFKQAGGSLVPVQTNAYAGPVGVAPGVAPIQVTQSPDNAATNATHLAGIRMTQAGENLRAGINPDGSYSGDMETTARAIANGQLPPPSGMALTNPKNQRILSRVMEINPQYDFTDVTAKKKAASDFTSGQQGNALRSVATANAHLDQLSELADALNNHDTSAINKVSNWYKTNTGNPAPTNFDAIRNIIGQEVVKAIVAGGGSAGERDEAAKAFSTDRSPKQIKEAIQHYRMVMGAQQQNLLAQRRAAGLSDSTLPQYNQPAPGAPASLPGTVDWSTLKK